MTFLQGFLLSLVIILAACGKDVYYDKAAKPTPTPTATPTTVAKDVVIVINECPCGEDVPVVKPEPVPTVKPVIKPTPSPTPKPKCKVKK